MNKYVEMHKEYLVNSYAFKNIVIDKGFNSCLFDINGKRYIDFTSGIGVNSLGYYNEKIINTVIEQVKKIMHTSNVFLNENSINAAKKLVELSGLKKVFFSNSGAESNEGAIKIARKYSYDKYGIGRGTILTLNKSFHGRTLATLMATGQEKFHQYFYPFPDGFKNLTINTIEELEEAIDDTICAIMIEGIQGEGGVVPIKKEFVTKISELCVQKDILLIFDEVQTGIGRTGYFCCYEYFNVKPDIVTLAKGLGGGIPIGAILCGAKTEKVLNIGDHGSTFGGNPLSTAIGNIVLDHFYNKDFLKEIKRKSKLIFEFFEKLNKSNIVEVRGLGLMIGIEIKGDLQKLIDNAQNNGLLVLTAGQNTIRLLPPLTISDDELLDGLNILASIL
ncbi:MAG: aspartate aminotransferase family protein [Sarcina sp.]